MTTVLWVLAAIGAVAVASLLALGLSRIMGGGRPADAAAIEPTFSRYEADNAARWNPAAIGVALVLVGAIIGLIVGLELA